MNNTRGNFALSAIILWLTVCLFACVSPFPFYWVPEAAFALIVLLASYIENSIQVQRKVTGPWTAFPLYVLVMASFVATVLAPFLVHEGLEPSTIALVPMPQQEWRVTSASTTPRINSEARAGPEALKPSTTAEATPRNEALEKLRDQIAELEETTPRRLRQLFPKGDEDPEWKRKSKAVNEELQEEFGELRKVLETKLNSSSALPPAKLDQLYDLERDWKSETTGKLSWPFTNYETLLGAIVPGGYRDDAPAAMVTYLKDGLAKLERIQGIVNSTIPAASK